jgi:primosomal protein N' (replication factor Y) (superfamily II helicase)
MPQKTYNTTMHYVEILVADAAYHGKEALTYGHNTSLKPGTIVSVPLRDKEVLGIVVAEGRRPKFKVKPVTSAPSIPTLPSQALALLSWMHEFYPSPWGAVAQHFLPRQMPKKLPEAMHPQTPRTDLPPLTTEQQGVLKAVSGKGMFLLHGETGTGKTRVYLELTRKAIEQGRSAIILTPEIGLTSQLEQNFRAVFPGAVVLLHSGLTEVTRRASWLQVLQAEQPVVIIGPRSALFSPVRNLGLVVIDEAHETAYKQDQAPYYHATRVASKLAALHGATVVLGSATPLVSDYFMAQEKQRPILRMTTLAKGTPPNIKHAVEVVDIRDRKNFTKHSYFSDTLIQSVKDTLARHEQILLFLNRRGTARVVFCERCGWQATCPRCDLPLVYHGDAHLMRCHSCDYKTASPTSCPSCHNSSVVFKTIGTKAIAEEAHRLFPEARLQRFDTDNLKAERIEQHYPALLSGDVDIIVGTQMLAKGLDLPKLGLVGVIIADTSLYFPDFTAQERTYQLLSQVLGRVGRGHRSTHAVVQTYAPDNPTLQSVLHKDWDTFYNKELHERQTFLFPPFCYLLKLACRRASSAAAQNAAQKLASEISSNPHLRVEGPAPSFREKVQGKYQWQLIIKSKNRAQLLEVIHQLPNNWSYDIDPMNLL